MRRLNSAKLFKEKSEAVKEEKKPFVGKIHESPECYIHNDCIISGYRVNFNSVWEILKSLFKPNHNEFVNVWTHLLGSLLALVLFYYTGTYIKNYKSEEYVQMEWNTHSNNKRLAKWPIYVFLFGVFVTLSLSVAFHLCNVHNTEICELLAKLDVCGIGFCTICSCYPAYYYPFYYMPTILYLSLLTILGGLFFGFVVFSPDFSKPHMRWLRCTIGGLSFVACLVPFMHMIFFPNTIEKIASNTSGSNLIYGAICYFLGVVFYAIRQPEKKWPGKFCIWGNSHQIWHLLVMSGMTFHFFACLDSYYDRLINLD